MADVIFNPDFDYVLLEYERRSELDGEDHLYDGTIIVREREKFTNLPFVGWPYHQMITRFAEQARKDYTKKLIFMRRDQKPKPMAVELEPKMADLLREDPVKYIKATSPPPRRVKLKLSDKVTVTDEVIARPIPAGRDTMAETFGDAVYVRMRRGGASECLACGRWKAQTSTDENKNGFIRCKCGFSAVCKAYPTSAGGWAGIHTGELLQVMEHGEHPRAFLPRLWNTDGPWITYENLKQRYERFCEERDNVQHATATRRRQDS
jgi:hypothetical protein